MCLHCSNCQFYEWILLIFVWSSLTRYMSTLSSHLTMMLGIPRCHKCLVVSSLSTHLTCLLRQSNHTNTLNRTLVEVRFQCYFLRFYSFFVSVIIVFLSFIIIYIISRNRHFVSNGSESDHLEYHKKTHPKMRHLKILYN